MSATGRTALLVVNAHSRGGRGADAHVAALEAGGMTLIRRECPKRERLSDLIHEVRNEIDCVILGGGDGTISGAAIALRDTGLPLGILPLGTANDLARTLELPTDPEGAAAAILGGRTRSIDLGIVNGQPFFNVASIGLTVEITRQLTAATKRRLGPFAYPLLALKTAMSHKRFSAIIRTGATIHRVRTMQVTVGNGRFYGGGAVVHNQAAIDDHMLDVYSLELQSRWRLMVMARAFRSGEHDDIPEIRTIRAPVVEVVTRDPKQISADGEIVALTPARFSVQPGAVTVYVP
jgi:diacylglycerol kinase (ATP)